MKKLILILFLALSVCAQTANPDAVFLTDAQLKRLNDTQARITLAQKELEAATEVQKRVLVEIQLELGANPDKYESLALVGDKYGFKRKAEKAAK